MQIIFIFQLIIFHVYLIFYFNSTIFITINKEQYVLYIVIDLLFVVSENDTNDLNTE